MLRTQLSAVLNTLGQHSRAALQLTYAVLIGLAPPFWIATTGGALGAWVGKVLAGRPNRRVAGGICRRLALPGGVAHHSLAFVCEQELLGSSAWLGRCPYCAQQCLQQRKPGAGQLPAVRAFACCALH